MEQLTREIRLLKLYAITLTLIFCLFFMWSFTSKDAPKRFEEIDVERINVIEKDGTLKMVISNKARQHPGLINGKEIKPRTREAGMIFFNALGDECGGLIYDADEKESAMVYSVDQRHTDQIMQLQYTEGAGEKKYRSYGLKLWDRPDSFPLEAVMRLEDSLRRLNDSAATRKVFAKLKAEGKLSRERFFAGKTVTDEVGLFINDTQGRIRLKVYVGKDNQPHIESFDENGQLIK